MTDVHTQLQGFIKPFLNHNLPPHLYLAMEDFYTELLVKIYRKMHKKSLNIQEINDESWQTIKTMFNKEFNISQAYTLTFNLDDFKSQFLELYSLFLAKYY